MDISCGISCCWGDVLLSTNLIERVLISDETDELNVLFVTLLDVLMLVLMDEFEDVLISVLLDELEDVTDSKSAGNPSRDCCHVSPAN